MRNEISLAQAEYILDKKGVTSNDERSFLLTMAYVGNGYDRNDLLTDLETYHGDEWDA